MSGRSDPAARLILPRAGIALALTALVGLAFAAAGVNDRLAVAAATHENRLMLAGARAVSRFGKSDYMLVLSAVATAGAVVLERRTDRKAVALRARRATEETLFFFVAIAASGIACQVLKHVIGRARPRFHGDLGAFHLSGLNLTSGFDSFPSGHSTSAFAAATAIALLRPAWGVRVYVLAVVIAASRILAEAHYPSDTVAGAALGTLVTLRLARAFAARDIAFPVGR